MAGLLISGPAGAGKSEHARQALADRLGLAVILDFNALLVGLSLTQALPSGRYPERDPRLAYLLPTAEYLRRAGITAARERQMFAIVTNSDGSFTRRAELLALIGDGAIEEVLDPGRDVVVERLSVNGQLSQQCEEAINRWYGRLPL